MSSIVRKSFLKAVINHMSAVPLKIITTQFIFYQNKKENTQICIFCSRGKYSDHFVFLVEYDNRYL